MKKFGKIRVVIHHAQEQKRNELAVKLLHELGDKAVVVLAGEIRDVLVGLDIIPPHVVFLDVDQQGAIDACALRYVRSESEGIAVVGITERFSFQLAERCVGWGIHGLYDFKDLIQLGSKRAIQLALVANRHQFRQKRESQLLETRTAFAESNLLASQMNQHFAFNLFASLDEMLFEHPPQKMSDYLCKYAGIYRKALQLSRQHFITLIDELAYIREYMELCRTVSLKEFEFHILVDENVDISAAVLPPMILQPLIENGIKHGIIGGGGNLLSIGISCKNNSLFVVISDNGKGIKNKSNGNNAVSLGIAITRERLEKIARLYKGNFDVEFLNNGKEGKGYRVELLLPMIEIKVNEKSELRHR